MLWRPLSLVQPKNPRKGKSLSRSLNISLGAYPVKRGLAEELGAVDRHGRGFSFDRGDIGLDVTDRSRVDAAPSGGTPEREPLPPGHRFFPDCLRETTARGIAWSMYPGEKSNWFVTHTFKNYTNERKAWAMVNAWCTHLAQAYHDTVYRTTEGSHGVRWTVAQEWQKRGVIHFHSIISGARLDDLSRKRWEHRWSVMEGGFARIYPAREKAAPYLAKYVGKTDSHVSALRRGGSWRGMTPPQALSCCQA